MTGTNCQFTIFHADGKDETNAGKFGTLIALAGEQGWELVAGSARTQDSTQRTATTNPITSSNAPMRWSAAFGLWTSICPYLRLWGC